MVMLSLLRGGAEDMWLVGWLFKSGSDGWELWKLICEWPIFSDDDHIQNSFLHRLF
jgi:hypothetical protein